MHSGHYTTSINCCKKKTFHCNDSKITEFGMIDTQTSSTAYAANIYVDLLHSIRSRPRKKHRNLWVRWFVSSWRPWVWSVYSIWYYIHIVYYSCIQSNWNKLLLIGTYIRRVGVAMTVCWIWCCYCFLSGFKCRLQLYSWWFSIL